MGQILLSGTTLVIGLLIARSLAAEQYAVYVLIMSVVMYLVGMQEALVSVPATVRVGRYPNALNGCYFRITAGVWFIWVGAISLVFCVIAITYALFAPSLSDQTIVISGAMAIAWCAYDLSRSVLIFYESRLRLVVTDIAYSTITLVGLGGFVLFNHLTLEIALLVVTIGTFVGLLGGGFKPKFPTKSSRLWRTTKLVLSRGKHSLVSAQIGWVQSQSYLWLTSAVLSLEALAKIAAARLIVAPFFTLLTAWVKFALPDFARCKDVESISRKVRVASLGIVILLTLFGAFAFYFSRWIETVVFDSKITQFHFLILAWVVVASFTTIRTTIVTALRALGHHKALTGVFSIGAVLSIPMCVLGMIFFEENGALLGIMLAEIMMAMIGYRLFYSIKRSAID